MAVATSNAQYFVEGSLGLGFNTNKTDGDRLGESTETSFYFSPQIGFWMNDKIAVGTRAYFNKKNIKNTYTGPETGLELENEYKEFVWRISAFSRYKFYRIEKISFLLDGSIYYEEERLKIEGTNSEWLPYDKLSRSNSQVGIRIFPAVSYDLNEKFSIITNCNFLSMQLVSGNGKTEDSNGIIKGTGTRFVFDTRSTLLHSLTNVQIGFIYNF